MDDSTDIAIVGAGVAGTAAALVLARQGYRIAIVDPHRVHPTDFRCEKLSSAQLEQLSDLGLADAVAPAATPVSEVVVARAGRVVDVRRTSEACLRYDALVNALRAQWPDLVAFHEARVTSIAPSVSEPFLKLSDGGGIAARLVVLATGQGEKLRAGLGMIRHVVQPDQSICVGFDLVNAAGTRISERALTYYGERAGDRIAFATFFPFGGVTRCNLFCYFDPSSAVMRELRSQPLAVMRRMMPGLDAVVGDVLVSGRRDIRVTDLYEIQEPSCDGVVLIGDAMHSSCPVTGTGISRVLTDVDRLCRFHLPGWWATPGMGASKIAAFYRDEVKREVYRASTAKAARDKWVATDNGLACKIQRGLALAKSAAHGAFAARSFRRPAFQMGSTQAAGAAAT